MKTAITLGLLCALYTVSMFMAGMLLQKAYVNRVMSTVLTDTYMEGCHQCLQFTKAQEQRDQLQGVEGKTILR